MLKSSSANPARTAARERVRRQLDELQANLISERAMVKALTPIPPLVLVPLTPLIPLRPKPPTTISQRDSKDQEQEQTALSSPELPLPKNPKECPWYAQFVLRT